MSDKKFYWLKINEHFFDADEIIYLESQDKGDTYIKIWVKLLLKCLKDKEKGEYGFLRFTEKIPYEDKLLSRVLKCDINDLRVAMKYFQDLNMLEILEDGTIYIEAVQKLIGKESESAERVRRHRERKKALQCNKYNEIVTPNKEEEEKINIEIEKEKEEKPSLFEMEKNKNFSKESEKEDFVLQLKNTPEFKKALNDFCIIKTDFEKIGNQVIQSALKYQSTIDEIIDALQISHKQNKSGILKYFEAILRNKRNDRKCGKPAPAQKKTDTTPPPDIPDNPPGIDKVTENEIKNDLAYKLKRHDECIENYNIDWLALKVNLKFTEDIHDGKILAIDNIITECRNKYGVFLNMSILN